MVELLHCPQLLAGHILLLIAKTTRKQFMKTRSDYLGIFAGKCIDTHGLLPCIDSQFVGMEGVH